MDFIFVIGPSGVGKTTLSKRLFEHYKGAFAEMNTVPEFEIPQSEKNLESLEKKSVLNVA